MTVLLPESSDNSALDTPGFEKGMLYVELSQNGGEVSRLQRVGELTARKRQSPALSTVSCYSVTLSFEVWRRVQKMTEK